MLPVEWTLGKALEKILNELQRTVLFFCRILVTEHSDHKKHHESEREDDECDRYGSFKPHGIGVMSLKTPPNAHAQRELST